MADGTKRPWKLAGDNVLSGCMILSDVFPGTTCRADFQCRFATSIVSPITNVEEPKKGDFDRFPPVFRDLGRGGILKTSGVGDLPPGVAVKTPGVASSPLRVGVLPRGVTSKTPGVAASPRGVAVKTLGVDSSPRGVAGGTLGVDSKPPGVAPRIRGVTG